MPYKSTHGPLRQSGCRDILTIKGQDKFRKPDVSHRCHRRLLPTLLDEFLQPPNSLYEHILVHAKFCLLHTQFLKQPVWIFFFASFCKSLIIDFSPRPKTDQLVSQPVRACEARSRLQMDGSVI